MNRYFVLNSHKDSYLLIDISVAPSGIVKLFILPRMRYFKHPILLIEDEEFALKLPFDDEKVAKITLQNQIIQSIDFLETIPNI